ncbi:MAG TPA: hypothetical protein VGD45_22265 [Steroidobacter sp.]|uniref:hypothetical protein n=1 Tax=Steroidobacter sp. TaxID=1978227 RepID=UPI002ED94635
MDGLIPIVAELGEPLALIGLAAVMLSLVLGKILSLRIFQKLSEERTYGVIKRIVTNTTLVALALILVGFLVSLAPAFVPPTGRLAQQADSVPKRRVETSERVSQVFSRQAGNAGSCVEDKVAASFDLCLEPGCAVTNWEEMPMEGQNYSFSVERDESMLNCVRLTLKYSDYGPDSRGQCRGHGYINMKVRLNGRCVSDPDRQRQGENSE